MTEPRRLLDEEGSELGRAVLRSASSDGLSSGARARLARRLALGAAAATLGANTASAATAGLRIVTWGLLKWLGAGLVATAVGVGAATVISSKHGVQPAPAVSGSTPIPRVQPSAAELVAAASLAEPVASVEPAESAPAKPAARAASSQDGALDREAAALEQVRAALGAGDAARAHRLLDAYEREFSRRSLGVEATLLRIEAFVRQGKRSTALSLARQVMSRGKGGPYASRIRALLPEIDQP